jgi:hypothetical protein
VGDQLSFVNQGGEVVLTGSMYDMGATGGDVLTVQADGSIAADNPAATAQTVTILVEPLTGTVGTYEATFPGMLIGGDYFSGQLSGYVTLPPSVFAAGPVLDLTAIGITLAGSVPTTADDLEVTATAYVSNAAGTDYASAQFTGSLASPVSDLAYDVDWSAITWTVGAGLDLSGALTVLSSAGGGTYILSVVIACAWD